MEIRWSPEAASDFAAAIEYIRDQNSDAAERVAIAIYEAVSNLENFPYRGRHGRVPGTRELVLAPLPYIVVYRVLRDTIQVARILHGSQRWP